MKTKPGKFAVCILIVALLAMFTGCGSGQDAEQPSMNISFENGQTVYTGTEQRFYQLEDGQVGNLAISVTRESGSLNISVFPTAAPQQYCYRGTDIPTSDFTVTLSESGEYKVRIEADHFAGSYGLEWTVSANRTQD